MLQLSSWVFYARANVVVKSNHSILRLYAQLGMVSQLHPDPVRTTEFAPALSPPSPHTAPASGYASPHVGLSWKTGRFSGQDFALQPDRTLRCPADQALSAHEQRREADGSLRVVYGASIVAALVRYVSSVNGRVAPPRSRARSAYCCIHWSSGMRRSTTIRYAAMHFQGYQDYLLHRPLDKNYLDYIHQHHLDL
ncbi:hypothetical protein [Ktedonobacter racemifer]|uniref:Uncharacterized protein n=1 Tax=Ktedonobacter racemifer DSM 44963 TaxID=485913 RepID=D6U7X5_KTERA|nr:hypothetical protein [Ktedonobacter racemifer]EFH79986.1 hypothetical protein Krac_0519 [Ktedonobacter racemifer DSM 44963]